MTTSQPSGRQVPSEDPSTPAGRGAEQYSASDRLVVWQTVASRRASIDAMRWQTPALGMTAQAFLLTLALAPDSSRLARLLASALSLILALMVMQLMAKHRRPTQSAVTPGFRR